MMNNPLEIGLTPKYRHFVEASISKRRGMPLRLRPSHGSSQSAPSHRADLDFLLLKSDVPRKLADALTRQLDAEKFIEVNGKLNFVVKREGCDGSPIFQCKLISCSYFQKH